MGNKLLIIGAGGHGKVVCDAVMKQGKYGVVGFVDAAVEPGTTIFHDFKVLVSQKKISDLYHLADCFIVAIGNNEIRKKLFDELKTGMEPATIIHPSAVISSGVKIGSGTVVLAHAAVNANTVIEENCIINTGVLIDHDCKIGSHSHLALGTVFGSHSSIAPMSTTAIGTVINSYSKR